jgi:hypothetical protein
MYDSKTENSKDRPAGDDIRLSVHLREKEFYGEDNEDNDEVVQIEAPSEQFEHLNITVEEDRSSKVKQKQKDLKMKKIKDKKRKLDENMIKFDRLMSQGSTAAGSEDNFIECYKFFTSTVDKCEELGDKQT